MQDTSIAKMVSPDAVGITEVGNGGQATECPDCSSEIPTEPKAVPDGRVGQSRFATLDWKLAWVVTVVPPVAFATAVLLWVYGYKPGLSELALTFCLYFIALTGIEVGFHRHFTHRSFKANRWVRAILAITGSFAFEGPVIWWAATHRRHHKYSDREGDPHSPHLHGSGFIAHVKGAFHAHMGWLFLPESTRTINASRYAIDLYRDSMILRIHMSYFYWLAFGILLPGLINGLIHWSWYGVWFGILWGGLVRIFLMNHVFFWCINSVTHMFGSRPFNAGDESTNNVWLAIPTLGESWHNNHHAFPSAACLAFHWWQIDIGGWIIWTLEKLGLVWDVKRPSPEIIAARENTGH